MGDEGMDPCECLWGHEMAMRRLLSLLRQSQAYCTETECFEEGGASNLSAPENFFFMALLCMFALALYMLRPRSLQNGQSSDSKPRQQGDGNNDSNGSPPPAAF